MKMHFAVQYTPFVNMGMYYLLDSQPWCDIFLFYHYLYVNNIFHAIHYQMVGMYLHMYLFLYIVLWVCFKKLYVYGGADQGLRKPCFST
jgi:hypothetical protein